MQVQGHSYRDLQGQGRDFIRWLFSSSLPCSQNLKRFPIEFKT